MLTKKIALSSLLALGLSAASVSTVAKVDAQAAADLGKSLTPFGAEVAGSCADVANGQCIPKWTGGLHGDQIPASFEGAGTHLPDPYPSDQKIFSINAGNLSQYQDKVPEGLQALMKLYPDTFEMPVYQSRRSFAAPDWMYDRTKHNATNAELSENGVGKVFGGIPFPILSGTNEEQALQAIWNHVLRWRGEFVVRRASEVAVQRNGRYKLVTQQQEVYFKWNDRNLDASALADNIGFYFLAFVKSPARLAGGAVLVHETIDQKKQPRNAWGYNAGQRRVRRAPNLAYDTPIGTADGLRTADDTDMYNGSPDRYNWRLVGKREMYIPYNSYRISSPDVSYEDMLMKGHVNPEQARYELHRVWVVEATLKAGKRHRYAKRTFYIDEDSWQVAIADQYDSRGNLWRVSEAFVKHFYQVPATWTAMDVFHDLRSKRYHVQNMTNEEQEPLNFSQKPPSRSYFSSAALRRRGRR